MFKIGYRTIKTAVGTAAAIMLAQLIGLESFASAGIITILCIQATKKKSLRASGSRFAACMLAMLFSAFFFTVFGFYPLTIGLILLLFIPSTVALGINEGIVTSSVIILHIFTANEITASLLVNESLLVCVGVGVALIVNWYMPSLENSLYTYQEQIEHHFSVILKEAAAYLEDGESKWDGREITETERLLREAKSLAFRVVENHLSRDEDVFYRYFKMREKQFEIVERILPLVTNLPTMVKQGGMLAEFIHDLSENVHPQNTAIVYLEKLKEMEDVFKEMELPVTREEFESRASLLQLMKEMEAYLQIKRSFRGLPVRKKTRMKRRLPA